MTQARPATASGAAGALLAELAGDRSIATRLMIVVAHPDDETIGIGGQLRRLRDVSLLHVTDGAPRDGEDAGRHGFAALADYAAARRQELAEALAAGDAAAAESCAELAHGGLATPPGSRRPNSACRTRRPFSTSPG